MDRCKIFIIFLMLVLCTPAIFADANQTPQKEEAKPASNTAESYKFAEELIEIPVKPFVVGKLTDSELMNMNPQLLKLYEAAVNTENQKNILENPDTAIKAWTEVTKITQQNPFMQAASARIEEWKKVKELFDRHQTNLDKIKMLLASTLLSEEQKTSIIVMHINEFGLSFGTKEVVDLAGKTAISQNAAFQAKIKETKQKRCEHNSGKDCFECGRDFAAAEDEILALFTKSCDLKYQPGCSEVSKIKSVKESKQNARAQEIRTYSFSEQTLGLIEPFVLAQINDQDILNTDPKALQAYETAVNKEKEPDTIKTPGAMVAVWEEVTKITEKNPFLQIAVKRLSEWQSCFAKVEKFTSNTEELKKIAANNSFPANYTAAVALNYLSEFGVSFGTNEAVKATAGNSGIANNESLASKIKEIRNKRCELKSALDCHNYAMKHAANEEEKAAYLKKACDLGSQAACSGNPPDETFVAAAVENVIEQPKEEKETATQSEDDKFKEELNQAGRKKRLIAATSTLVPGIVIGALGGLSFYGMSEAKKDRDKYVKRYNSLGEEASVWEFNKWKKKAKDADSRRKTYMILGGVGVGVGAALIATGITLYSIEFEGEKEVKKKYNISFGAKPMDGTIQFALNW